MFKLLFHFRIMEKYFSLVKNGGKKLNFISNESRSSSSWKFLVKDEIHVEGKGSMEVLRTLGDGVIVSFELLPY